MKRLEKMALKELWQLFPILLKEHNPQYAGWYRETAAELETLLTGMGKFRLSHIGSTAVPGLVAKPTVDILLELPQETGEIKKRLTAVGWLCMSESETPWRQSFNRGYTPKGFAERVYHLHVRLCGDHDELYFRDYLLAHPDTAAEYGRLKQRLAVPYQHDRDGYTMAKTEFVSRYTQEGKREFAGRYEDDGRT